MILQRLITDYLIFGNIPKRFQKQQFRVYKLLVHHVLIYHVRAVRHTTKRIVVIVLQNVSYSDRNVHDSG